MAGGGSGVAVEATHAQPEQVAEPQQEAEPRPASLELGEPSLYANRELSWLDFNNRVLQLAEDGDLPLLERAKFLAIWESNLDEFFMVRVAGLHDQVDAGIDARGPDSMSPSETIDRIAEPVAGQVARSSTQWRTLRSELGDHGIRVLPCESCDPRELEHVDRIFNDQIFPTLTPLAVGPGRPFPYISNLSLSLAVWLRDPVTETETFARVKVPKEVLPRLVAIDERTFVPLEEVIARHLDRLFPGMEILNWSTFRVTRDADFTISDEADDLVRAVEDELRRRRFGEVVRLEVSSAMQTDLRERLIGWLDLEERQVYDIGGPLDLTDLWELYDLDGHGELREEAWTPVSEPPFQIAEGERVDIFGAMRDRDLLAHHPYHSFNASVERFMAQAVEDPAVLAIKLTVYRTDDESSLIPGLVRAAEQGKQAVCMVELKARFDERRNIGWARALEEAGAHVVHGIPGLKTHAKALLVVRREGDGVRNYVHVGTGNYNAKTARLYEDFGLFTADRAIAADVADMFNSLTGLARPPEFRKALVSPAHLRGGIVREIEETIDAHEGGRPSRIVMKMNALTDRRCIDALYRASQAGVDIDLVVRGICCLRPGIEGVSENIRVVSVVGRFLEHSRVYGFHRGSESRWYVGSSDLMPRNLDTRVELVVPVGSRDLRDDLEDTLDRCLADDTFSWSLGADGAWERRRRGDRSVHLELAHRALRRAAAAADED
ncbi:MAG: polyphosphate kinase 1 [Actinobacteria bacterium]|nr:polyphosphate kinase 1 [Actinomycetota bacterium]